jgi:hypothetical protein
MAWKRRCAFRRVGGVVQHLALFCLVKSMGRLRLIGCYIREKISGHCRPMSRQDDKPTDARCMLAYAIVLDE